MNGFMTAEAALPARGGPLVRVVLATLVALGLLTTPAFAGVKSVTAPKRVRAGAAMVVTVTLDGVRQCRLTTGKGSSSASVRTAGRDVARFSFAISAKARPGRYTLSLRCDAETRRLRLTVTKAKGRRGTSKRLVRTKITAQALHDGGDQTGDVTPPCCKPVVTPTPTPTPPANAFRAVYALASDQAEKPGYVSGIVATINEVNRWFATQTLGNVGPRWVREPGGAPLVAVVRLARPAATYEAPDGFARLREDLEAAAPLTAPAGKSAVWMDVVNPLGACGLTSAGISWLTERPCGIVPVAPTAWPADATYITAHELAHNFGAVPDCAPHSIGGGHVGDDRGDLLYAGGGPRDWNNLSLDPGHDDYYGTGNPCGDIATSPFWDVKP